MRPGELGKGFAVFGTLDVVLACLLFGLGALPSALGQAFQAAALLFGVTVWSWSLPAALVMRRRGRRDLANGILAAAATCSLLSAGCWVFVVTSFG